MDGHIHHSGTPTLILCLRAGLPGTEKPAANIPPGIIRVPFPLYPGAVATTAPNPTAFVVTPASPYLKAASAEYRVPVGEPVAETWYRKRSAMLGFHVLGTGSATNSHLGTHSEGMTFVRNSDPNQQVVVSFHAEGAGHTLLNYWATDIAVPPRPPGSKLPLHIQRVEIAYRPWQPNPPTIHRTLTAPAVIARLIQAINALPVDAGGAYSCAVEFGQGATLNFVTATGETIPVVLNPACDTVQVGRGPSLSDNGLWNTIKAVVAGMR